MKIKLSFIAIFLVVFFAISCKKDNYSAPSSSLTGRLVYNSEPIQVEYDRVPYEVYQYGFGRVAPINGSISPDGKFSHLLFDGDYKFVIRPGQGPFLWPQTGGKADTVNINVKGATVLDIVVQPYHMVRTPKVTLAASKVTGIFKIEKIITGANAKNLEKAALFINKTIFVGNDNNIAKVEINAADIADLNNVSLNVAVPAITPTQNYVFARIGVKTEGVEDWIFSPVEKISF